MRVSYWLLGGMLALGSAAGAFGQQVAGGVSSAPATSVAGVLRNLAERAGVVFVGQVEKIRPGDGVVEITFAVQQPVLGVVGSTYVMREWAGRWTGGQHRFVVGERAMFFLHAPNTAGLSSPVKGMTGAVPVIPMGAGAQMLVDVRWLTARVGRPVGSAIESADGGAIGLADAVAVVKADPAASVPEPVRRPLPVGVAPRPVPYPVVDGPVAVRVALPVVGPVVARPGVPVVRHGLPVAREATDAQW